MKNIFDNYYITERGEVLEIEDGVEHFLPHFTTKNYSCVALKKGNGVSIYRVHRLVSEFFVNNPNGYRYVKHIDGNRNNNAASNLEWTNKSTRNRRGEDNTRAKLNSAQVLHIINQLELGKATQAELAEKYGVSRSLIAHIATGRVWAHLQEM